MHGLHMIHWGQEPRLFKEDVMVGISECVFSTAEFSGCLRWQQWLCSLTEVRTQCFVVLMYNWPHEQGILYTPHDENRFLVSFTGLRNCWIFLVGLKIGLMPRHISNLPIHLSPHGRRATQWSQHSPRTVDSCNTKYLNNNYNTGHESLRHQWELQFLI